MKNQNILILVEDFKWIKNPPNTFIGRIYFNPETESFYIREPLPSVGPEERK